MKNLKKVLALGLALVMLLGMFTIASAAEAKTALTDMDKVAHKDAVNLLVDLGVVAGKPDGTYDPEGTIDRASWAKMVYFAATGSDNADAYLGTASNLTDIAGNWAESYISYMAATGIVSGDGQGKYNPSANVTVAEAAKTMLTTLGYVAEDRGYVNDAAWAGNIMSDAKLKGIMDQIGQSAMQPLTRDNAAQMIFNTLETPTVTPENGRDNGEKYVVKYLEGDLLMWTSFSLVRASGTVSGIDADGNATFNYMSMRGTAGTTTITGNVTSKVHCDPSDIGKDVSLFVEATRNYLSDGRYTPKFTKLVSTHLADGNANLLASLTKGFGDKDDGTETWPDLFTKGKGDFVAELQTYSWTDETNNKTKYGYNVEVYLNGAPVYGSENDTSKGFKNYFSASAKAAMKLKGNLIELYDNDGNGDIDVVKIFNYSVAKLTADVKTRTSGGKDQVQIPGVVNAWTDANKITGADGLKKDDVVLFYDIAIDKSTDKLYYLEKPETVNGTATDLTGDNELVVGGKAYAQTGLLSSVGGANKTLANWVDYDNEYEFCLDKDGAICYAKKITNKAAADDVVVILASKWVDGGTIESSNYLQAKLLFMDGTTEIVKVNTLSMLNGASTPELVAYAPVYATNTNTNNTDEEVGSGEDDAWAVENTKAFWQFTVNKDGAYDLTKLSDMTADYGAIVSLDANKEVEQKATFIKGDNKSNADTSTIFVVRKGDEGKSSTTYHVFTGRQNAPKVLASDNLGGVQIAEKDAASASFVFLSVKAFADDIPDGFVYIRNAKYGYSKADDCRTFNVVLQDGTEGTLKVKKTLTPAFKADTMVKIDQISDGIVQATSVVTDDTENNKYTEAKTLTGMGKGNITLQGATKTYTYDESTICVVIDQKTNAKGQAEYDSCGVFDPASVDVTTVSAENPNALYSSVKASVILDGDNCTYIYLIRTEKAAQ